MSKPKVGDQVLVRFTLWDDWMEIEHVSRGILFNKYVARVYWTDVGWQTYCFRRWRIKARIEETSS